MAATTGQEAEASTSTGSTSNVPPPLSTVHLPTTSSQSQACALLICAIQHLLFAKGQVYEPIAVLQSKRAREKLKETQQQEATPSLGGAGVARRKRLSFPNRRRLRRVDELLVNIQRLSKELSNAVQQLSEEDGNQNDLTVLVRFGQSPLSSRQEVNISIKGLLSLPPYEPALQDSRVRRQKLATSERKLVRFLLGTSVEDESFARVLNCPLGLTRAHIFLLAPSTFSCRGWSKQRQVKVSEQNANREAKQTTSSSPTPMPTQSGTHTLTETQCNYEVEEQDDKDTRRLKRLQALAEQRAVKRQTKAGAMAERTARRGTKRQPLSASLAIDCSRSSGEGDGDGADLAWFGSKIVLKGVL